MAKSKIEQTSSSGQQPMSDSGSAPDNHSASASQLLTGARGVTYCSVHGVGGHEQADAAPCSICEESHSVIDLARVRRIALMVTPPKSDSLMDQIWEAISSIRAVLHQQSVPMKVTSQTVFLRDAADADACRKLFDAYYGDESPATNFVVQPPCGGQALAIEAWALGGEGIDIRFVAPDVVAISYDGLRWVHTGGIAPNQLAVTAYEQSQQTFQEAARRLEDAGTSFHDVVRIWLYMGGITDIEQGIERYRELNRARTDFFDEQTALGRLEIHRDGRDYYPASTGIGMMGHGLTVSCMTLQTERDDVQLLPLENPRQVSAFNYSQQFSPKSPKFSRAMAVVIGDYVTTWISGTASITNSETVHVGDVEKQTEQTIDNIESLISRENFSRHGVEGAGATLGDLAKVRVYVKHPKDYGVCRQVCERRLGPVPIIYAQADVCRPDLLVEIEGVAFSRRVDANDGGGRQAD